MQEEEIHNNNNDDDNKKMKRIKREKNLARCLHHYRSLFQVRKMQAKSSHSSSIIHHYRSLFQVSPPTLAK